MKRILKLIGITLGIILVLAIILAISLVTFVNPNRFKPLIIENTKKYTGRELIIDGDLSWSFFPNVGVKVNHARLNNPSTFKQTTFAEIQRVTVNVKLLPLLHGQVESSGMVIDGMKLFLIKNASGVTNWQDLQSPSTKSVEAAPISSQSTSTPLGLAIANVTISNAAISWQNEQAKQYVDIQKFNFNAKNIKLSEPFPIKMDFQFKGKNPDVSGSVSLKGNVILDLIKQSMKLSDLTAQIANLKMTGKINITDLSTRMHTTGRLQIQPFDVKKWLQATGQDNAALQVLKDLNGDFEFSAEKTFQSVKMQGNMKIDEVKTSNVRISNVAMRTQLENGVLALTPITGDFYQGSLQGQTNVNLNNSVPRINMQMTLTNTEMQPLLADLAPHSKLKLSGKGNVSFQITTMGSTGDAIVKNLNGTGQLNLENGALQGMDIPYMVDNALAIAKNRPVTRTDTNQTPFGELKGSLAIKNGVVSNNDLSIDTPVSDTKGNGEINLVTQRIDYQLLTTIKQNGDNQKNNLENLYGLTIPISIKGNLKDPSIRLDTSTLMQEIAHEKLQDVKTRVQERIEKKLMRPIPGGGGGLLNKLLR